MNEKISSRVDTLFFGFLVLSVATLPFSMKVSSVCIYGVVACWLFRDPLAEKWKRASNPWLWLFISFYCLHVLGMAWTDNIRNGLWELERKSSLLVLPIVLGTTRPLSADAVRKILKLFVGSVTFASLFCLAYATYRVVTTGNWGETDPQTLYTIQYFFYDGLAEVLMQPMYFSCFVAFSICIVVFLARSEGKRAHYFIIPYLVAFLFLLSARIMIIAFLALIVLNVVIPFAKSGNGLQAAGVLVLISVVIAAVIYVTPPLRDRFKTIVNSSFTFKNDPEANKHLAGKLDDINMRLAKWYFTIEAGKTVWLFGQGTGDDMDALMQKYRENNFAEGYVPVYNSHNQYLQTWLGLGIPGVLVLVALFAAPAFRSLKQGKYLYLNLVVLMALFALTESVFCRQYGVVFFSFFNALLAFHYPGEEPVGAQPVKA